MGEGLGGTHTYPPTHHAYTYNLATCMEVHMNLEAMLNAIIEADEDVRLAKKRQADLKGEIIKDMVRNETYDFLTINVSKMKQCIMPAERRLRR